MMTHRVVTVLLALPLLLVAGVAPALAQGAARPWYERIRFGGDFRSRYEGFYQEDSETRHRGRLRLRLRVDTEINPDTQLHLQLATGDSGTPVSTNQTFSEFFTPKPFLLDRAYVAYNPEAARAISLGLGKFATPFTYTQLLLDDDLNFEGGFERLAWEPREGIEVTLGGLQTAVNERSAAADSYMVSGHGELGVGLGRHRLHVAIADYYWGNPNQIAVASVRGPLESILTNVLVRDATAAVVGYASRFNVVDTIGELTLQTARDRYPVRLLAEYARNTRAANDRDSGLWLEAEYGRPGPAGTWSAAYTYGWVEQDLTPSAFVFSDMPGTNQRLHMIDTSFVPKAGLSLDTTLHLTRTLATPSGAAPPWLTRLHVGAVVRF